MNCREKIYVVGARGYPSIRVYEVIKETEKMVICKSTYSNKHFRKAGLDKRQWDGSVYTADLNKAVKAQNENIEATKKNHHDIITLALEKQKELLEQSR
jgi:N-acetyl-gamma-glutamylphosphate reductase